MFACHPNSTKNLVHFCALFSQITLFREDLLFHIFVRFYVFDRYEKVNQSVNQSFNQSVNQPVNQSINQSIDQSINQSINQSVNQTIDHWCHGPVKTGSATRTNIRQIYRHTYYKIVDKTTGRDSRTDKNWDKTRGHDFSTAMREHSVAV